MPTIPPPPLTFWQGLRYCRDPFRVWFHFKQVGLAEKLAEHLIEIDNDVVRATIQEILEDEPFWRMIMERHLAATKLLTGVFFFLMTIVLIATLFLL